MHFASIFKRAFSYQKLSQTSDDTLKERFLEENNYAHDASFDLLMSGI